MRKELVESGDDILVEDTAHEYWARGANGNGLNMLGVLLMIIRDALEYNTGPTDKYRAPLNGYEQPCYNCGEGNHTQSSCMYDYFVRCKQCSYDGHKEKDCPDRLQEDSQEERAVSESVDIGNSEICNIPQSIIDTESDCYSSLANISIDLSICEKEQTDIVLNGKTGDVLIDEMKNVRLKYPKGLIIAPILPEYFF